MGRPCAASEDRCPDRTGAAYSVRRRQPGGERAQILAVHVGHERVAELALAPEHHVEAALRRAIRADLAHRGFAVLSFNFRGTMGSEGGYGLGVDEVLP